MLNIRQKTRLLNIVASPFFLAIPITIIIILFLPNPSSKFKIELKNKQVANKMEAKIEFCDLNNDGIDERIIAFHNSAKGEASIKVLTNDDINYDAWNFHGYYQKTSDNFFCTDINNDGYAEIFIFYYKDDSVFMAVIQPFPDRKIIFNKKFITTVWLRDGNIDFTTSNFTVADLNNDKNNDFVFILNAGFSRQPRCIYSYDFYNDSLINSKTAGAYMSQLQITDLDKDSIIEIFCGSSTPGNISNSMAIPYSDYYSWFFGFNNKLKPLFSPIKNVYYPSSVGSAKYTDDKGKNYIAVAFIDNSKRKLVIQFYDSENKIFSEREFVNPQISKSNLVSIMKNITVDGMNLILMGVENNEFILINENNEIIIKRDIYEDGYSLRFEGDLNKDNKPEYIFSTKNQEYIIYDNNLENPVKLKTDINTHTSAWLSTGIKHNGVEQDEMFIKTDNYLSYYSYGINYFYYLKYPLWLLIYSSITIIFWFSQRLQNIQTKRRLHIEETINSLQLKTIKSQMDPHFMFNVLNGLANNVAKGNTDEAYNQLLRFSQLLRSMMQKTDKIDISLNEEISFVESYLELEKFRFKEDFEFKIEIKDEVDTNIRLPRMLVQLLVENSIKHGLRNKVGLKRLKINVQLINDKTIIAINDNGVGRKKAMKTTHDTGKGLKLINDMIRLNRKLGGKLISVTYTDLYNEGHKAIGTTVEVII